MFSGIIEQTGKILHIAAEGANITFTIAAPMAAGLKVDQSVAHNGVCLTVTEIKDGAYKVTAVEETLQKTNLGNLKVDSIINLERCITLQQRLDGHLVQGHVDTTATCTRVEERDGSWLFSFHYPARFAKLLVEKGSITINGVSLTAFACKEDTFSVTIIPYTWQHTGFRQLRAGDSVNLEFDILGKYVARHLEVRG